MVNGKCEFVFYLNVEKKIGEKILYVKIIYI